MRVLVADGQRMVVDGLARVLGEQPDVRSVHVVASVEEIGVVVAVHGVDAAVIDWRIAGGGAPLAIEAVASAQPECRVVVLADLTDVGEVGAAFSAGCDGFVTRDCGFDELVEALRAVRRGDAALSPAAASSLARTHQERGRDPVPALTAREVEVVGCLARGLSNREIAEELFLSAHTVRNHVQRISRRLGARNRLEVVVVAARLGLVDLVPGE